MIMWTIDEANVRDLTFREMTPHEVLYDFDGPRIFTFKVGSDLYFACWSDEDSRERRARYLVVLTSAGEIDHLKRGASSLDRVLNKRFLWCIDRDFNNEVIAVRCISGGYASIPDGFKPEKGTLLWDHLEPASLKVDIDRPKSSDVAELVRRMSALSPSKVQSTGAQRRAELRDRFFQIAGPSLEKVTSHFLQLQSHNLYTHTVVAEEVAVYRATSQSAGPKLQNAQKVRDYVRTMTQNSSRALH